MNIIIIVLCIYRRQPRLITSSKYFRYFLWRGIYVDCCFFYPDSRLVTLVLLLLYFFSVSIVKSVIGQLRKENMTITLKLPSGFLPPLSRCYSVIMFWNGIQLPLLFFCAATAVDHSVAEFFSFSLRSLYNKILLPLLFVCNLNIKYCNKKSDNKNRQLEFFTINRYERYLQRNDKCCSSTFTSKTVLIG